MKELKYPVVIQTFSKIIEEGYVYVGLTLQDCREIAGAGRLLL